MSDVISGEGTTISVNDEVVGFVTTISGPNSSRPAIDKTHLGVAGARIYRSGKRNNDPVSIEGWYIPDDDGQAEIVDIFNSGAETEFVITYQTAPTTIYTFNGIITQFNITGVDIDNNVTFTTEIQPSGDIVKTNGGA